MSVRSTALIPIGIATLLLALTGTACGCGDRRTDTASRVAPPASERIAAAGIQPSVSPATGSAGTLAIPAIGVSAVLIAAGDIADCGSTGDESTAAIVDTIPGTVAALGDNAYPNGTDAQYANCYAPSWGRFKARTRPTPGNHEYRTAAAGGYFRYFGEAAGDRDKGYYSYDLGTWHIIVLNSNSSCTDIRCGAGSLQLRWLNEDLAAHRSLCTLAYWHHPRFNSGAHHGNNVDVAPFWNALYTAGADVVLNGHEHVYERFAAQTPTATPDSSRGIRQFTVGTGGRSHYEFGTVQPNSEVREGNTDGVLKLELEADGYSWQFIPVRGHTFSDTGSGRCH